MIRSAKTDEADTLTRLSFESKRYWDYPEAYYEIWHDELSISPDFIDTNDVFVFENGGIIIGYYALVTREADMEIFGVHIEKGYWLEYMFVTPKHIGRGIGKKMFEHMRQRGQERGIKEIRILADPNSRGFYEKMGCQYVKEHPSTIVGRSTPLLTLTV